MVLSIAIYQVFLSHLILIICLHSQMVQFKILVFLKTFSMSIICLLLTILQPSTFIYNIIKI